MNTKHYWIIIIFSLLGFVQVKGQECESLIEQRAKMIKSNKRHEVQKIEKQIDDNDCEKWRKVKPHALSAQKKAIKTNVLTLSEDSVFIDYEGSEHVVTVSGGGFWKAEVDCEWCRIEKEYDRIIIQCDENHNTQERVAKVTVTKGKQRKSFVVKNGGAPDILMSQEKKISFPSEGDRNEVSIFSNTAWTIDKSMSPDWLALERKGDCVLFSTEMNKEFHRRTGRVLIKSLKDSLAIEVNQLARDEKLAFSKDSLSFGPHGGEDYIKVYFDDEDWEIKDGPTWCNIKKIGKDSIWIRIGDNDPIDLVRLGNIKIKKGDQVFFINITQDANPIVYKVIPDFSVSGKDLSFGFSVGYVYPQISASSGGNYTGSVVNYALGNNSETASYSSSGGFNIGVFADKRIHRNFYLKAGLEFTHYKYKNIFNSNVERHLRVSTLYYLKGTAKNDYEEDYSVNQLDIPILLSYRFSTGIISHLQLNVGPIIHYGLSAKMKLMGNADIDGLKAFKMENQRYTDQPYTSFVSNETIHYALNGEVDLYDTHGDYVETYTTGNNNQVNILRSLDASPLKRFGWGIRVGAAYEYAGVSFGLEYNLMMSNLANKEFWEGDRWKVFGGETSNIVMSGYKQRNNYLSIKIAYTFRY